MKMSQLVEVNFIIVAGELYDTFSRSRSIVENGGFLAYSVEKSIEFGLKRKNFENQSTFA